jgi:hypothetical protein
LRRASRVGAVCAALKAAQIRRAEAAKQIRFAKERIRHLPEVRFDASAQE